MTEIGESSTDSTRMPREAFMQELVDTVLPDTDNLEEKYPIFYPTTIDTDLGLQMKELILKDFDAWNNGYDAWAEWTKELYTEDASYDYRGTVYDKTTMQEGLKDLVESSKRVRLNNVLVSEDWAAIHFWNCTTDADGNKSADNHMQFLHFVETEDGLKIDLCFAK